MVKKSKDLPDSAAHPKSGLSLSLCLSPTLFILRVLLDPAEAEPRQTTPVSLPGESHGERSLAGWGSQSIRHDLGAKQRQNN